MICNLVLEKEQEIKLPNERVINPLLIIKDINTIPSLKIKKSTISYVNDTVIILKDKT